jgi:hypothetical protein
MTLVVQAPMNKKEIKKIKDTRLKEKRIGVDK